MTRHEAMAKHQVAIKNIERVTGKGNGGTCPTIWLGMHANLSHKFLIQLQRRCMRGNSHRVGCQCSASRWPLFCHLARQIQIIEAYGCFMKATDDEKASPRGTRSELAFRRMACMPQTIADLRLLDLVNRSILFTELKWHGQLRDL